MPDYGPNPQLVTEQIAYRRQLAEMERRRRGEREQVDDQEALQASLGKHVTSSYRNLGPLLGPLGKIQSYSALAGFIPGVGSAVAPITKFLYPTSHFMTAAPGMSKTAKEYSEFKQLGGAAGAAGRGVSTLENINRALLSTYMVSSLLGKASPLPMSIESALGSKLAGGALKSMYGSQWFGNLAAAGGAKSTAASVLGGTASFLGPMASIMAVSALSGMIKGAIKAKAQRKFQATRRPAGEFENQMSLSPSLRGFKSQLIAAQQLQPSDQLQLQILEWIEAHTSVIPLIYQELDYIRQEKEKPTKKAEEDYQRKITGESEQGAFGEAVDSFNRNINLLIAKFDPFTQLSNFIFSGMTPKKYAEMLKSAYGVSDKKEREFLRKESQSLGLNLDQRRLLNVTSRQLLSLAPTFEAKQIALLSGIYDLQRLIASEAISIRKFGFGVSENMLFSGAIKGEETAFGSLVESIKSIPKAIVGLPGINAIFEAAKTVYQAPVKIYDTFVSSVKGIRNLLFGEEYMKYKQDPEELLKAVGLYMSTEDKAKKFVAEGLPQQLEEVRSVLFHQLEVQQNSYMVLTQMLQALTGMEASYVETQQEKKELGVWDALTGRYVTAEVYEKLQKSRAEQQQTFLEGLFRESIAGRFMMAKDVVSASIDALKSLSNEENVQALKEEADERRKLAEELQEQLRLAERENELIRQRNAEIEKENELIKQRNKLRKEGKLGGELEALIRKEREITKEDVYAKFNEKLIEKGLGPIAESLEKTTSVSGILAENFRKALTDDYRQRQTQFEQFVGKLEKTLLGYTETLASEMEIAWRMREASPIKSRETLPQFSRRAELLRRYSFETLAPAQTFGALTGASAGLKGFMTGGLAGGALGLLSGSFEYIRARRELEKEIYETYLKETGILGPGGAVSELFKESQEGSKILAKRREAGAIPEVMPTKVGIESTVKEVTGGILGRLKIPEVTEALKKGFESTVNILKQIYDFLTSVLPRGPIASEASSVAVEVSIPNIKEVLSTVDEEFIRTEVANNIISNSETLISSIKEEFEKITKSETISDSLKTITEKINTFISSSEVTREEVLEIYKTVNEFIKKSSTIPLEITNIKEELRRMVEYGVPTSEENMQTAAIMGIPRENIVEDLKSQPQQEEIRTIYDVSEQVRKEEFSTLEQIAKIQEQVSEQNKQTQEVIEQLSENVPVGTENITGSSGIAGEMSELKKEEEKKRQESFFSKFYNMVDEKLKTLIDTSKENKGWMAKLLSTPKGEMIKNFAQSVFDNFSYIILGIGTIAARIFTSFSDGDFSFAKFISGDFEKGIWDSIKGVGFWATLGAVAGQVIPIPGINVALGALMGTAIGLLIESIEDAIIEGQQKGAAAGLRQFFSGDMEKGFFDTLKTVSKWAMIGASAGKFIGPVGLLGGALIGASAGLLFEMIEDAIIVGREKGAMAGIGSFFTGDFEIGFMDTLKTISKWALIGATVGKFAGPIGMGGGALIGGAIGLLLDIVEDAILIGKDKGVMAGIGAFFTGPASKGFTDKLATISKWAGLGAATGMMIGGPVGAGTGAIIGGSLGLVFEMIEDAIIEGKEKGLAAGIRQFLSGDAEISITDTLKAAGTWAALGAGTGFLIGGPTGAVIGAFLGGGIGTLFDMIEDAIIVGKEQGLAAGIMSFFSGKAETSTIDALKTIGKWGMIGAMAGLPWFPIGPVVGALVGAGIGAVFEIVEDMIIAYKQGNLGDAIQNILFGSNEISVSDTFMTAGKYAVLGAGTGMLAAGPVGLLVGGLIGAGVGFLLDAIEDVILAYEKDGLFGAIKNFIFGDTQTGFSDMFASMGKWAAIGAAAGSVFPVVGTVAGGLIGLGIGYLLEVVEDFVSGFKEGGIKGAFQSIYNLGTESIAGFFPGTVGNTLAKAGGYVLPIIGPIVGGVVGSVVDLVGLLFKGVFKIADFFATGTAELISYIFPGEYGKKFAMGLKYIPIVGPIVGGVVGTVIDALVGIFSGLTDIGSRLKKWVKSKTPGFLSWIWGEEDIKEETQKAIEKPPVVSPVVTGTPQIQLQASHGREEFQLQPSHGPATEVSPALTGTSPTTQLQEETQTQEEEKQEPQTVKDRILSVILSKREIIDDLFAKYYPEKADQNVPIYEKLKLLTFKLKDPQVIKDVKAYIQSKLPQEKIPDVKLMTGGIVESPTVAMLGEMNRRELVLPLENDRSKEIIGDVINEELREIAVEQSKKKIRPDIRTIGFPNITIPKVEPAKVPEINFEPIKKLDVESAKQVFETRHVEVEKESAETEQSKPTVVPMPIEIPQPPIPVIPQKDKPTSDEELFDGFLVSVINNVFKTSSLVFTEDFKRYVFNTDVIHDVT